MAGFNPVGSVGGFAIVKVLIDDSERTSVGDQTFVFIDLPAGNHIISYTRGGLLAQTYNTSVEVKAGKTTFVKIVSEQIQEGPAAVVLPNEAQRLLTTSRHNYKQPLPFNQQPSGALRAL